MKSFLLCLFALLCAAPAVAGEPKVIQQCADGYVWTRIHNQAGEPELILWCNGFQVGNFRVKDGQFWGYIDGVRWKKGIEPPIALPRGYELTKNFGMGWTPRDRDENVLHFGGGGKPDIKKSIRKTSDASEVPDFSKMWSITVVSADADKRKVVMDDFATAPALQRWRGERLKEYPPDSWALKPMKVLEDESFRAAGLMVMASPPPDANFKAPIECIYGYAGAEDLASRLREVEAKYNPNVHAGGRHAGISAPAAAAVSGLSVAIVCTLVGGVILGGLILFLMRRRPQEEVS